MLRAQWAAAPRPAGPAGSARAAPAQASASVSAVPPRRDAALAARLVRGSRPRVAGAEGVRRVRRVRRVQRTGCHLRKDMLSMRQKSQNFLQNNNFLNEKTGGKCLMAITIRPISEGIHTSLNIFTSSDAARGEPALRVSWPAGLRCTMASWPPAETGATPARPWAGDRPGEWRSLAARRPLGVRLPSLAGPPGPSGTKSSLKPRFTRRFSSSVQSLRVLRQEQGLHRTTAPQTRIFIHEPSWPDNRP